MNPTRPRTFARTAWSGRRRCPDDSAGFMLSLCCAAAAGLLLCCAAAAEEAGWKTSGAADSDAPRIVRIEIEGSVSLTKEALLRELSTRLGTPYDPGTLENDLRRLWKTGRYRAARWGGPERLKEGVGLTLHLEERPVLRKIEFIGNKRIDAETLKSEVEKVGLFAGRRARYDEAVATRALVVLKRLYREKTYFLAEIGHRTEAYEGAGDATGERGVGSVKLVFEVEENRSAPIKGLRIVGNRAFTDGELNRSILYFLKAQTKGEGGRDFDRLRFARALGEIRRLYRNNGYLDARAELVRLELFTLRRDEGKVRQWLVPHIEITEGPLYRIGEVALTLQAPEEGPPLEVTREELLRILAEPSGEFTGVHKPVKPGSVYSDTVKRQAVKRLETALGQYGRIGTEIRARDVFGEQGTKIDLDFVVKPSRPFRVRVARVVGNHKTKANVFLRELVQAGIRPQKHDPKTGEVIREASLLDSRKIDLAKKNIYYTGLVKSEFDEKTGLPRHGVEIRPIPLKGGLADLRVEVNENETGRLMMGFSMSSNGELAGQIEFRQDNFDIFGLPRSWGDWTNAFMGAGQSFSLSAYFGTISDVYRAKFAEPYFLGLPLRFELEAFDTESHWSSYYDESRSGVDCTIGRKWSLHRYKRRVLRAFVSGRNEAIGIDAEDTAPGSIKDEDGTTRVARAGVGLIFDSLDNRLRPTEGVKLKLSRDAAGGYLGGEKSFTELKLDYQAHDRVGRGLRGNPLVVNFRLRTSYADPYFGDDTVPFYQRYYAGGIGTIRGFDFRSVGPRDPATEHPLGGTFRTLGTLEYTFPLERTNSIRGVFFLDAGYVWQGPSDFDADDLKKSAGFGLEIMPEGLPFPISMYWSYVIDRKPEDETQVFSFMFGNMFFF